MIKNNIPTEKKEKVHVSTLNGTFFHEKTNSGFIQINKIDGKSVQNGTPTPDNPIEVKSFDGEIVTSGKNLFDLEYMKEKYPNSFKSIDNNTFEVTMQNIAHMYQFFGSFGNERVIVQAKVKVDNEAGYENDAIRIYFVYTDGTSYAAISTTSKEFVTIYGVSDKNKILKGIEFSYGNNGNKLKTVFQDLIISVYEGQDDIEYEPFHATKTEKITLRSLPNGVKDTLERQNDGSYLLTQRVGYVEFDGSETLIMSDGGLSSSTNKYFVIDKTLEIANYDGKDNKNIYCNYFVGKNLWTNDEVGAEYASAVTNNTPMSVRTRTPYATVEEFTAKLKEWKANGKPLTVLYKLQNPPQPRKLWLSPLSAYEGQTNIFANSEVGAEMEVEVLTINAVNGKLHELKENILRTNRPEVLLWSGSMAKGQSAVIGGLSNFKKFKAYINNTGIVVLDFIGTEGGGKRKFTGEFYNYSSNNEEILAFCSAFINDNTFTNVMSNYVSLKNVAVHYENPIIQIWGIY